MDLSLPQFRVGATPASPSGAAEGDAGFAPTRPSQQKIPTVCRLLRTKTAFGFIDDDMEPWQSGESTTAVFWCLGTMETAGPDEVMCHPSTCQSGRGCYQPPVE